MHRTIFPVGVLIVLLSGCIAGTTVRQSRSSSAASPSPNASVSPSPSASPSPSPSPTPVGEIVLDTRTNVFGETQDEQFIYYTVKVAGQGMVLAAPRQVSVAGTPIVLATSSDANTPWGITCDTSSTGFVYYTDYLASGLLRRVPKPVNNAPGGSPQILASGLNLPTFVALGPDGLLYVTENAPTTGRVLRFNTSTLNQDPSSATFVQASANDPPPFKMNFLPGGGGPQLFYTLMNGASLGTSNGEIRSKSLSAANGAISTTTLVATGLVNPTDLTFTGAPFATNVTWAEFSPSGTVRTAPLTSTSARGTPIGQATGSVSLAGAVSLQIDISNNVLYVALNQAQTQTTGPNFAQVNMNTDLATNVIDNTTGGLLGAVNFPFQFFLDIDTGLLYVTEFNFGSGGGSNAATTSPSRLIALPGFAPTTGP